jgi:hypothetical protein
VLKVSPTNIEVQYAIDSKTEKVRDPERLRSPTADDDASTYHYSSPSSSPSSSSSSSCHRSSEFFFSSPGDSYAVTGSTGVVASDLREDGRTRRRYPHLHAALDPHLRDKPLRYWASKLAGRMQDIMNTGKQVYIYFQVKKGGSQVALHRVVKTFHSPKVGVELWGRRDKSAVSLRVLCLLNVYPIVHDVLLQPLPLSSDTTATITLTRTSTFLPIFPNGYQ